VLALDGIPTVPIRAYSQRFDLPQSTSGGGSGTGKVQAGPLFVSRDADRNTPILHGLAAQGQHIEDVELTLLDGGLTIGLEDAQLVGVEVNGLQDDVPQEELAFSFGAVRFTFTPSGGAATEVVIDLAAGTTLGPTDVAGDFAFFGTGVSPSLYPATIPFSTLAAGLDITASLGGGGAGKPSFDPLTLVTGISAETIAHLGAVATGAHTEETTARFVALDSDGGEAFDRLRYDLEDVLVQSVQLETKGSSLEETFSMSFKMVTWTAQDDADEAEVSASYDVAAGTSE
jgi:type VI protein secretion system component Hcp